jgi:hypothetical protein
MSGDRSIRQTRLAARKHAQHSSRHAELRQFSRNLVARTALHAFVVCSASPTAALTPHRQPCLQRTRVVPEGSPLAQFSPARNPARLAHVTHVRRAESCQLVELPSPQHRVRELHLFKLPDLPQREAQCSRDNAASDPPCAATATCSSSDHPVMRPFLEASLGSVRMETDHFKLRSTGTTGGGWLPTEHRRRVEQSATQVRAATAEQSVDLDASRGAVGTGGVGLAHDRVRCPDCGEEP